MLSCLILFVISFLLFHYQKCIFSIPKLSPYIQAVYSYRLYKCFCWVFFSFCHSYSCSSFPMTYKSCNHQYISLVGPGVYQPLVLLQVHISLWAFFRCISASGPSSGAYQPLSFLQVYTSLWAIFRYVSASGASLAVYLPLSLL